MTSERPVFPLRTHPSQTVTSLLDVSEVAVTMIFNLYSPSPLHEYRLAMPSFHIITVLNVPHSKSNIYSTRKTTKTTPIHFIIRSYPATNARSVNKRRIVITIQTLPCSGGSIFTRPASLQPEDPSANRAMAPAAPGPCE